jgi:hypothetical protein
MPDEEPDEPKVIETRARFARDIMPGDWKRVRWNRQVDEVEG